jgi:hypothetical protein
MINNPKVLLALIVGFLLFSLLSWLPAPDAVDVIRFAISCVLCWFLYQQANWARVVMGVLSLLGALVGALFLVKAPAQIELLAVLAAMVIFYGFAAYVLLSQRFKVLFLKGTDA